MVNMKSLKSVSSRNLVELITVTLTCFEKEILKLRPDIALFSVGVTATALASRIAGHGIQAVDLGSIGGFFQRWPRRG